MIWRGEQQAKFEVLIAWSLKNSEDLSHNNKETGPSDKRPKDLKARHTSYSPPLTGTPTLSSSTSYS